MIFLDAPLVSTPLSEPNLVTYMDTYMGNVCLGVALKMDTKRHRVFDKNSTTYSKYMLANLGSIAIKYLRGPIQPIYVIENLLFDNEQNTGCENYELNGYGHKSGIGHHPTLITCSQPTRSGCRA